MMCFGRKSSDPRSKRNDDIEKSLRADKKKQEREVKMLLLGEAES
jgi:guanine nucleotide-binding protein subunit alpha